MAKPMDSIKETTIIIEGVRYIPENSMKVSVVEPKKQLTIEELREQFEKRNRRAIQATPIVADNIWEGWFQCARANNIIKE